MGLSTALSEITLVLFTTLAPSGAVALCVVSLVMLACPMDEGQRRRLEKFLYLPLIATMAGLVASATHLGNPSNALYTFLAVGRSPLSNEVFAAVCFLALSGIYWLCSFRPLRSRPLRRAWLVAIVAAGAAFVWTVAFAYDAEPIVTWRTPLVPLALFANACIGGPLLAAMTLRVSKWGQNGASRGAARLYRGLAWAAVAGLAVSVAAYALQGARLPELQNHMADAMQLVPGYWAMVAAYAVLCAAGIAFSWRAAKAFSEGRSRPASTTAAPDGMAASSGHRRIAGNRPSACDALALACAFCGIFVMRFAFYMMHMTVGIGL